MRTLVAILLLVLFAIAHAGEVTVLVGESHSSNHGDGVWYQDPFPHALRMNSPSLGIRWDTPISPQWSAGVGYIDLGSVSSSASANALDGKAPGDHGYNAATKACNGTCLPLSHFNGSGNIQGIFGALTRHFGNWSLEAGVSVLHPTWTENIPDWTPCMTCRPQAVSVAHNARLQFDPMIGAAYRYEAWSVHLSLWETASQGDQWSSLYMHTYNLSVGRTF